jgi:exonuclease SbcD
MKLFHLADLHFGKCIHGYSLIEMGDQPFWVEQLLKKADELKPDVVLISGDVYDRAVPSKEAVNLLDKLLTGLSKRHIPVLIISGNHDSGSRLAFADKLLCNQGVYIAGDVVANIKCVTLQDDYGPVHFWLVPYLFPAAINVVFGRDDLKDYDSAMRTLLEKMQINPEERNVILSHQFVVAGGEKPAMGGSETTVGGIGQVDVSVFDGFDYAALGHIHNAQRMGREEVRYAGSPLAYHFSEANQKKGLTVVELREKGSVTVSLENLPILHQMCEITGTMEEIVNASLQTIRIIPM